MDSAEIAAIRKDKTLSDFLSPSFHARDFTKRVMQRDTASSSGVSFDESAAEQTLHAIAHRVRRLDQAIRELVMKHQEELLAQAGHTADMKASILAIDAKAAKLAATVANIKRDVMAPFGDLKRQVLVLERIQAVSDILRRVLRVQYAIRKLHTQLSRAGSAIAAASASAGTTTTTTATTSSATATATPDSTTAAVASFDSRDLMKAAQVLFEIESCTGSEDGLQHIDAIAAELPWVSEAGRAIRSKAQSVLYKGMDALNQAELGAALQIFFDLRCLPTKVDEAVKRVVDQITSAATSSLDVAALAQAVPSSSSSSSSSTSRSLPGSTRGSLAPPVGAKAAWRSALWTRIDAFLERLYRGSVQLWNLQRVLTKKKDPVSHRRLIDVALTGRGSTASPDAAAAGTSTTTTTTTTTTSLFSQFWTTMTRSVKDQLASSVAASPFLRDSLVEGYPRLRASLLSACQRLQRSTESRAAGMAGTGSVGGTQREQDRLLWVASNLLEVYLARSLSRLNEPVKMVFGSSVASSSSAAGSTSSSSASSSSAATASDHLLPKAPSHANVSLLVKAVNNEFHACSTDPRLAKAVSRGVVATLKTFVARMEGLVSLSADATSMSSAHWQRTPAQRHNHELVERLAQVDRAIADTVATHSLAVDASLAPAVNSIRTLISAIVNPYVLAVSRKLEASVFRMHDQSYVGTLATESAKDAAPCSGYVSDLDAAIAAAAAHQLSGLPDGIISESAAAAIAGRLIVLFVRLASLIRPLDEPGKLRLTRDMAQLEMSLRPLCPDLSKLGFTYGELRAFRELLFTSTGDMEVGGAAGLLEKLRPSTVMHTVAARAPAELELPFVASGLSVAQYSAWVDSLVAQDVGRDAGGSAGAGAGAGGGASADPAAVVFAPTECFAGAETAVWERVRMCADKYAQRVSSVEVGGGADGGEGAATPAPEYGWLVANGPKLLAAFKATHT